MPKISLLMVAGATPSSVTATLDLFRIASRFDMEDPFQLDLFSTHGGTVFLSSELGIKTQPLPNSLAGYDAVILPGFFAENTPDLLSTVNSTWSPTIHLLSTVESKCLIAASCYGTFVLAESGLLDGRTATTTWWLQSVFEERYPKVRLDVSRALVDDGNLLTAGAMTAHTDLSLHVLRRLKGHAIARQVGSIMLVDEAKSSQQPFMALQRRYGDPQIDAAIGLMEQHYNTALTMDQLARDLHTSYRSLHRKFRTITGKAPLTYLQALRIEQAKELLETTRLAVEQIAVSVGYQDISAFRRTFTRISGISPAQYRKRFRRS